MSIQRKRVHEEGYQKTTVITRIECLFFRMRNSCDPTGINLVVLIFVTDINDQNFFTIDYPSIVFLILKQLILTFRG